MRILGKLGQCLALAGVVAACNGSDRSNADGSAGAAAHGGGAGSAGSKVSAEVEYLTPSEHLVRASMALRGIRPSLEELAAVRKDPKYVAAIVDYYLDSPEFGVTMRELHAEALLVGVDPVIYPAGFPSIGKLSGMTAQQLNSSI
ncbi:MAG TPA: hypothetical protein VHM19_13735, partial [Polyangiales bacterium]|nr:hypothetical protein [Polyangiales bacterium]